MEEFRCLPKRTPQRHVFIFKKYLILLWPIWDRLVEIYQSQKVQVRHTSACTRYQEPVSASLVSPHDSARTMTV